MLRMHSRPRPRLARRSAALLPALLGSLCLLPSAASADSPPYVPGEILVGMRSGDKMSASMAFRDVGWAVGSQPDLKAMRLKLHEGVSVSDAIARLKLRAGVAYAEPNYILTASATPNDLSYKNQYSLRKTQTDLAWSLWQPQTQVIVAILDTGVSGSHPDLTNKMLRDSAGIVGYDAFTRQRSAAGDVHGHGTHCAGIAAAQINNGMGVAGVAGWNGVAGNSDTAHVKLMPVKVLSDSGSGTTSSAANGILWAADHGAKVISMSLGGAGSSSTLNNAIQYALGKGCVVVAAAGNSGSSAKSYPAACTGVLSVAATTSSDTLASYSNYGSWVKVAAPGSGIYSTYKNNGYATMSGTSMATPFVAGEAALLFSLNPALSNTQIHDIIVGNCDVYTPYSGRTIAANAGRVNVFRALQAAGGLSAPTNLTATPGDRTASLSWTASPNADSYTVWRSTTSGGSYTAIASGRTATTYADANLSNGTTYYYVVTAISGQEESGASNQASVTPQSAQALPETLMPLADATVRGGSYGGYNYGISSVLEVKKRDAASNYNRCAYLQFDLRNVTAAPASASLEMTVDGVSNPVGRSSLVKVYSVSGAWAEKGLTWNNAPGLNRSSCTSTGSFITSHSVTLRAGTVHFDLTAFVAANRGQIVTIQLIEEAATDLYLAFKSREAGSGKPTLRLTY